ncbi:hypothetical protein M0802_003972 [Mischocyttarus mexicanus]|nr:hypothetical protein M0802_003972 [Mischocyttarus mexicanus]
MYATAHYGRVMRTGYEMGFERQLKGWIKPSTEDSVETVQRFRSESLKEVGAFDSDPKQLDAGETLRECKDPVVQCGLHLNGSPGINVAAVKIISNEIGCPTNAPGVMVGELKMRGTGRLLLAGEGGKRTVLFRGP